MKSGVLLKFADSSISEEIGFEPQGWIFDEFLEGRVLIPELLSGTVVRVCEGRISDKASL